MDEGREIFFFVSDYQKLILVKHRAGDYYATNEPLKFYAFLSSK